jgi:ABC-type nitrate/sulfonate/bicarbonate transport system permease component
LVCSRVTAGLSELCSPPVMAFVRPIPPIAFIRWRSFISGLGELGKVVLIFFTAFNYVHVNAHSGAANIPIAYRRAAQSLGLTQWQTFFRVILPGSIPQIFTGLKVAMALSWAVVVAAELTRTGRPWLHDLGCSASLPHSRCLYWHSVNRNYRSHPQSHAQLPRA